MKNKSLLAYALIAALVATSAPVSAVVVEEQPAGEAAPIVENPAAAAATPSFFSKMKTYASDKKTAATEKWNTFSGDHKYAAPAIKWTFFAGLTAAALATIYAIDKKTFNVVKKLKNRFGSSKLDMDAELAASLQHEEDETSAVKLATEQK